MSGQYKVSKIKKQTEQASRTEQQQPIKPVQSCPNKNWIELVYKYDSERAVSGARYEIFDANTNQSLACGKLDQMGFARVEGLPDRVSEVKFLFSSDPKPFEIYPGYKPGKHNLTPESVEVKEEDGTVMTIVKWVGVALEGDFADDQSFGQIAFGTVVTLIPVVDQIGDVRDIIANLHKLTFRGKYDDFGTWFALVVTVIGCVPEIGTAIKGVCKSLFKAIADGAKKLPLKKLIRLLNSVGEGNVIRFLREFLSKIHIHGQDVAAKILKMLDAMKAKFAQMRHLALGKAEKLIDETLEKIGKVYERVPSMVRKVIDWLAEHLKNTLDDAGDFVMSGVTRAKNGARQLKEKFIRLTGRELKALAEKAGMKPEHIEKLAAHCRKNEQMAVIRVSNPDSLKFQGKTEVLAGEKAKSLKLEGKEVEYLPKPLEVKLKTAKGDEFAEDIHGLVVRPNPEKMADWEKKNIEELEKKGYWFDDKDVLRDPEGNAFHGDYDVQSVHRRVQMENPETGKMEDVYLNEFSNPDDGVSAIKDMNSSVVGDVAPDKRPFQHGAEGDYRVKLDENGKIVYDEHGKPVMVKADDLNAGGAGGQQMKAGEDYKLGRQYGDDEKYLVVDADGNYKIVENPDELKEIYENAGLPWEYDARPAIAPANAAKTAAAGK